MSDILNLITQISDKETVDFENSMEPKRKERVTSRILAKIDTYSNSTADASTSNISTNDNIVTNKFVQSQNPVRIFKKKKWLVAILAATFLFSMVALAANDGSWDIRLMEYWNLTDTTYLSDGAVLIDVKSNQDNHMSVTAYSSIGDKNNTAIILEVDITDEKSDELLDLSEKGYFLFDSNDINLQNKNGSPANFGYGSCLESFVEDGKLYFLLTINCENINRLGINLILKDLYYETEAGERTLFKEGTWNLQWTYQYAENVKTYYPFKTANCSGINVFITKVEVSPISISIWGIRNPFSNNEKDQTFHMPDSFQINKILLKDGKESTDFEPSVSGSSNNMFLDSSVILSTPKEIGEIFGLQIGDTKVYLN